MMGERYLYILDKWKDLRNKGSALFMRESSPGNGHYSQKDVLITDLHMVLEVRP